MRKDSLCHACNYPFLNKPKGSMMIDFDGAHHIAC